MELREMQNNLAINNMYQLPRNFFMGEIGSDLKAPSAPGLVYPSSFRGNWVGVDFIGFMREAAIAGIPWPALLLRKVVVDLVNEAPAPGTLVCYMKYAHMLKVLFLSEEDRVTGSHHSLFLDGKDYLDSGDRISRPVIIRPVAFWNGSGRAMALWPGGNDGCEHSLSDPRVLDAGNFLDYSSSPRSSVQVSGNIDRPGSDLMTIPLAPVSMFDYEGVIYLYNNSWFSYPS